jgi:SNF2 family DNA or RNA helicase
MSFKARPCGVRKSKANPNAYSKDELVELAMTNLELSKSKAERLTVKELCEKLDLKIKTRSKSRSKSRSRSRERKAYRRRSPSDGKGLRPGQVKINAQFRTRSPKSQKNLDKNKVCSPRVSKQFPNRFTREELEEQLIDMGWEKKNIKKLKYEDLCTLLNIKPVFTEPEVTKVISPVKRVLSPIRIPVQKRDTDCMTRSKKPLKDHQKLINNYLKSHRAIIAVHSVGSGKTLSAVIASNCFLQSNPNSTVYVVTPTSLQQNFKDEMTNSGFEDDPRIIFYTYQAFANAMESKEIQCKSSMLIVDEAHNLRNVDGVRTNAVIECASKAKKVMLLTATPMINRPYDIIPLITMIDGSSKAMSEEEFEEFELLSPTDSKFIRMFGCKTSFFEPDQSERAKDYPEKIEKDVYFPMDLKYLQRYNDLESLNIKALPAKFQNVFDYDPTSFYTGLRIGANNLDDSNGAKFQYVLNLIKNNPEKKFVVFSHFLDGGAEIVKKMLDKHNIKWTAINGTMSKGARDKAVKAYNDDIRKKFDKDTGTMKLTAVEPKVRVLLISKAGGEGLDLKRTAGIILIDPAWNESSAEQVIGRAVRFKSHDLLPKEARKVDVYRLYTVKPVEHELIEMFGDAEEAILDEESEQTPSVDLYLKLLSIKKQKRINTFIEKLKQVSIENIQC